MSAGRAVSSALGIALLPLVAAIAPVALWGCSDSDTPASHASGDPPDDGPPDDDPPAKAPRKFIERGLFGSSPVNNLVLDPAFDPAAAIWMSRDPSGKSAKTTRRVLARSPADLPVLVLEKSERGEHFLYGFSGSKAEPLQASVWLGRSIADAAAPSPEVVVFGVDPDHPTKDTEYPLAADGDPVELEGVRWQSYAGLVEPGSIGMMLLIVVDDAKEPLWVTGPLVADLATAMTVTGRQMAPAAALPRAARPAVIAGARAATAELRARRPRGEP